MFKNILISALVLSGLIHLAVAKEIVLSPGQTIKLDGGSVSCSPTGVVKQYDCSCYSESFRGIKQYGSVFVSAREDTSMDSIQRLGFAECKKVHQGSTRNLVNVGTCYEKKPG